MTDLIPSDELFIQEPPKKNFFLVGGLIGVVCLVVIVSGGFFFIQSNQTTASPLKNSQEKIAEITEPLLPPPTPFPFQEMTVPGLRSREYKSSLGELSKTSETATYTSYITSYDSDGLQVNGLLTIPKGPVPRSSDVNRKEVGWPAVVFVHGYIPPTQYQTTQNYVSYVDYLARNGLVVFKIDLRGHDQSEGEAGGGYYSADYVIDTLNAYAALQSSDFVNPNGIGLWGHSMAGNVLLRSLAAKPEIPGIVIWAGAVYTYADMQEFGIDDNSYRPPPQDSERVRKRQLLRETHGDFSADNEFWKQVAPTNYLSDIKGAIEIHHAVDDNVVSVEYSRNLMNLLDNTSVPHQLFEYTSGGHNLTGSSFNQAMQRTVTFFQERLR